MRRSNSNASLHENFRYPPSHQEWKKTFETFRYTTVPYHTRAMMMYSNYDWTAIIPNLLS